jgi:hypothetical protein
VIRYALVCDHDHAFEAWFSSSAAFEKQEAAGLLECPSCGSAGVRKQIMAPTVRDSKDRPSSPEAVSEKMAAEVRRHIAETHDYVGERFADEARAMYYGEADHRPVWGEVTPETARALLEEGVPAMPLPKPFAPEKPRRRRELN